jgi:hypothetical protein
MPKMFSLDSTWPFRDKDKPQEGIPVRMVGTWTDTVMTQPGQKTQRGFGGRIMFYDKEGKKPILVDGQLVVYAFDETGREPTDNKPTRRYVFPADQMPIHMSKSELGASYSFWLPWDEAGGPKTEVGLICRFEPKGGGVVTGEQTKHLLPGPIPTAVASAGAKKPPQVPEGVPSRPPRQTLEDVRAQRNADQQARLTSFETPTAGGQPGAIGNGTVQMGAAPERHLTAATIALPQNYQLPDAAAMNSATQAAGYQPAAGQMPLQIAPNATQMQFQPAPQNRAYNVATPAAPIQQMGGAQPYIGTQLPLQQSPVGAPAMFPGVQAVAQSPVGATSTVGQIQQQAYQQPVVQPPMMQPPPTRLPQVGPQAWQQAPNQIGTATLNSPAAVSYR